MAHRTNVTRVASLTVAAWMVAACVQAGPSAPIGRDVSARLCDQIDADEMSERPASAGSVRSGSPPLRVHYCHPRLRPLAARVLRAATHGYRVQVGRFQFAPPLSDGHRGGGPELDVYLVNLGRAGRAQIIEEPPVPDAPVYPGYIVIDYRTPEHNDVMAAYVVHEINHAMQNAVGARVDEPFLEAIAAWVDDQIHPRADILPAMVADFQREPFRSIYFQEGSSYYEYGAALFVDYLVQRYGIRLIHAVLAANEPNYLRLLDHRLSAEGFSLEQVLRDFARCRVRTGRYAGSRCLSNGRRFPEVALDQVVSPLTFVAGPVTVRARSAPQALGTAYIGIDLTTPLEGGLAIEVEADPGPGALAVDLLGSDSLAPLDAALVPGGGRRTLVGRGLRPGARLWLAVTNLGQRPFRIEPDPAKTAHGFAATFRRLPQLE